MLIFGVCFLLYFLKLSGVNVFYKTLKQKTVASLLEENLLEFLQKIMQIRVSNYYNYYLIPSSNENNIIYLSFN